MNRAESMKFLTALYAMYPNTRQPDPDTSSIIVDMWQKLFSDVPFEIMQEAALHYMRNGNQFIPSASDITEQVRKLTTPEIYKTSAEVAYSDALKVIRKWGFYREAESLASMEPLTQLTVKALGYSELCQSEVNDTGTRAHFYRTYDAIKTRAITDIGRGKTVADLLSIHQSPQSPKLALPDDEG